MTIRIPKLVYEDIEPAAFARECSKLIPTSKPKFKLCDLVYMPGSFGRKVPAMIAGFESRTDAKWHYALIRPRDYDGGLERVSVREEDLEAITP